MNGEQVQMGAEDVTAAADLIAKALPGAKIARAVLEHVAASILRRGMLIERRRNPKTQ